MSATLPAKNKVPIKHCVETKSAIQRDPEPEPSQAPTAAATAVKVEDPASDASSPITMNATRDLLDNSDMDLPIDPEPRVNDVRD